MGSDPEKLIKPWGSDPKNILQPWVQILKSQRKNSWIQVFEITEKPLDPGPEITEKPLDPSSEIATKKLRSRS